MIDIKHEYRKQDMTNLYERDPHFADNHNFTYATSASRQSATSTWTCISQQNKTAKTKPAILKLLLLCKLPFSVHCVYTFPCCKHVRVQPLLMLSMRRHQLHGISTTQLRSSLPSQLCCTSEFSLCALTSPQIFGAELKYCAITRQ